MAATPQAGIVLVAWGCVNETATPDGYHVASYAWDPVAGLASTADVSGDCSIPCSRMVMSPTPGVVEEFCITPTGGGVAVGNTFCSAPATAADDTYTGVSGELTCVESDPTGCIAPDNTGDADTGPAVDDEQLSTAQLQALATKERAFAANAATTAADLASGVSGVTVQMNPDAVPSSYALGSPANNYEGEGDGGKTYTCGPSSSRNMVQTMTGHDYGEAQFVTWEGTTTSGTVTSNIPKALNAHFSSYDTWTLRAPSSASDLVAAVSTDTYEVHHGVIFNVATQYLDFWGGHAAKHFDWSYGYDNASGGHVKIAEEWDPPAIGLQVSYGNPYGLHSEAASKAFNAIANSPSGDTIW